MEKRYRVTAHLGGDQLSNGGKSPSWREKRSGEQQNLPEAVSAAAKAEEAEEGLLHLVEWERSGRGRGRFGGGEVRQLMVHLVSCQRPHKDLELFCGERGEVKLEHGEEGSGLRKLVYVTADTADLRAWPLWEKLLSVQPPTLKGMPPFWQ